MRNFFMTLSDWEPVRLGVHVMPSKDGADAVYTPWVEASADRYDQRLNIGGALVWQDGMLHVAMALDRSMPGERTRWLRSSTRTWRAT